jgi:hypothetical protein
MTRAEEKLRLAGQRVQEQSLAHALLFLVIGVAIGTLGGGGIGYWLNLPTARPETPTPVAPSQEPQPVATEEGPTFIEDPNIEKESEALQAERRQLRDSWLESAEQVANQTGDGEAKKVVRFLRDNGCLLAPISLGVQFLEEGKTDNWVGIVPLLPGDETKSEYWQKENEESMAAWFLPTSRFLVLRSNMAFSPTWQGILLLHEGHHACTYIPTPYDWEDTQTFCYKERDTHAFQNRVMQRLGGVRYEQLLRQEINRMRTALKEEEASLDTHYPQRTEYNFALDGVFGEAQSQMEQDARQSHFWIHAVFVLMEEDLVGDVEDRKALFLRELYEKANHLPEQNR